MRCFTPLEDELPPVSGDAIRLVPYQIGMICSHQARIGSQCTAPTLPSIESSSPVRTPMRAAVPPANSST